MSTIIVSVIILILCAMALVWFFVDGSGGEKTVISFGVGSALFSLSIVVGGIYVIAHFVTMCWHGC